MVGHFLAGDMMTKILAIDDKSDNLTVLKALLGKLIPGCSVITAQSGAAGIEKAKSESPDTILLDIRMPGMDGYEVCKRLKSNSYTKHIPVIMLTAMDAKSQDLVKGLESGADAYLTKPVNEHVLIAQVNTALRIRRAEDGLRRQRNLLEYQVRERTSELSGANAQLREEIEERKVAEELLQEKHKFMSEVLDCAQEGIIVYDRELRYQLWNPFMERLSGVPVHDVLARHPLEVFPFLRETGVIERIKQALEGGTPRAIDFPYSFPESGRSGWASNTNSPLRNAEGEIIGVIATVRDITDQKLAEASLRESEQKFRNFADHSLVGIYLIQDGVFQYVNPKFADIFGYTVDECLDNMHFSRLVYPEDLSTVEEQVQRRLSGEFGSVHYEFRGVRKDGEMIHLEIFGSSILFKGRPAATGTMLDITERKRAQMESRINSKRLDIVSRIAGMADADEKTTSDFVLEKMTAPLASEIGFLGFLSQDEKVMTIHAWSKSAMEACGIIEKPVQFPIEQAGLWGESVRQRTPMIFNDYTAFHPAKKGYPKGHVEITRFMTVPVFDGDRIVAVGAVANKTDPYTDFDIQQLSLLLESMWEQIRRKRSDLTIAESEIRWRSLAESSPEHILLLDRDLKIEFSNYASPGLMVEQLIGTEIVSYLPEDRQGEVKAVLESVLSTGKPATYETSHVSPEGKEIHYESVAIARKVGEEIVGLTLSARDITEKYEAEKQRALLEARLTQAQRIEAIGVLAGGIAHDFNNLLFPIIGSSELLLEDIPSDTSYYKNVEQIYRAARRAGDLVKQILSFSRQSDQKKVPVRIQVVLQEAVKLARSTIPSNIEITQYIQNDCTMVMADPSKLHQIAMNLITNAYHAVEETGGTVSIQLKESVLSSYDLEGTSLEPGKYAVISVADTGRGIDAAVMGRIFEPYFTTKELGKGTGLGLSVVFGIVKEYGGDIHVYSEVGKGATFHVYLPILNDTSTGVAPEKAGRYETGTERILIVDDEELIAQLEKQMLERSGYQVEERTSSIEALKAFRANPDAFDLVITDMTMPNMTGDRFAGELLSIKPDIPIIICTGFSEKMSEERAGAIGIKGFLMKPVGVKDLTVMVRKVLDEANGSTQG